MGRKLKFVKRNKEETKQKILNAAIKIFAENSYDKATFKMIEAEAGVSETLISRYFENKRGLVVAVLAQINDNFLNTIDESATKDSLYDEFHEVGEIICENFKLNHSNFIVLYSVSHHDPTLIKDIRSSTQRLSPSIERIKKFQDLGDIPKGIDLSLLYQRLMTTIHALLHMIIIVNDISIYEEVKKIVHFNIDMFIYGISEKNKSLMNHKKSE